MTVATTGEKDRQGFILVFSLLMLLGISAMAVGMVFNSHQGQVTAQNHKNRIRAFYASDGLRALLAQEVIDGRGDAYIDQALIFNSVEGHVWNGLLNSSMTGFKETIKSRDYDEAVMSNYLGSNWKYKQSYGVRWHGYIIPPVSGPYTFIVRADDQAEFFLSEDDQPEKLSIAPIAAVTTPGFSWPNMGFGRQKEKEKAKAKNESKAIPLMVGKRYYFEFYHTQSWGQGFGEVGWSGPNHMTERPIPGKRLARFGTKNNDWDTTRVGPDRVRYTLKKAGPLVYTMNTEAIFGGRGDTAFRAPLSQTLSLLGDNPAPPETLWQPVIFYDYRADGTNPEFERGNSFAPFQPFSDMVKQKGLRYTKTNAAWFGLDSIGKPMRGTSPRYNCGVERWFQSNAGYNRTYKYAGGPADCTESPSSAASNFENIVIRDSIPFIRQADLGANAYQFKRFSPPGT
ncbi:MAG TPA: PA14 domain-containing protein, partial [Fibrobacteria bacterium]|nr:PA14 domain-containing protein [Fibrobacteria bacterium]